MIEKPELLEPFGVPDVFVTGLGYAEHIGGGNWRFTFFVSQEVGGDVQKVVAAKIIMPADALPAVMHMTGQLTNTCACQAVRTMARN